MESRVIDLDEIRQEVAKKHNFLLDLDDPVLITVTICEVILNQYVEMVAAQNAEYVKTLTDAAEASVQKGLAESKATAGKLITDASNYVSDQVSSQAKQAIALSISEGGKKLLQAQNELLQKAEAAKRSAVIAGSVSVVWAVFSLLVAVKFLGGV